MIDVIFIRNFVTFLSGFVPVLAIFIAKCDQLNHKKIILIVQVAFILFTIYVALLFPYVLSLTVSSILFLYPLFVVGFNMIFLSKFGVSKFSKIFAVSLMLSFVITELHELPLMIMRYSAFDFTNSLTVFLQLSPLYALLIAWLAAQTFKLKASRNVLLSIILGVLVLFPLYLIFPNLDTSTIPLPAAYLKRVYCFALLALIFRKWSDP